MRESIYVIICIHHKSKSKYPTYIIKKFNNGKRLREMTDKNGKLRKRGKTSKSLLNDYSNCAQRRRDDLGQSTQLLFYHKRIQLIQ